MPKPSSVGWPEMNCVIAGDLPAVDHRLDEPVVAPHLRQSPNVVDHQHVRPVEAQHAVVVAARADRVDEVALGVCAVPSAFDQV